MNKRIHDTFDSVHAEEALKRSTKEFLASKSSMRGKSANTRWIATVFACFVLLLLGFGGWQFYISPVSAISVDVNPSIELSVNRFDRIVLVEGYNADGIEVAETVDIKNMIYSDGLDTLMQSDVMKAYIDNGGFISITVIGSNEKKSKEMMVRINSCKSAAGPNVECQCGSSDDVIAAHESRLSFGKYRALLELQALDPSVTADDIRSMTMREIRNRIEELSGETGDIPYENCSENNENCSEENRNNTGIGSDQHHGRDDNC